MSKANPTRSTKAKRAKRGRGRPSVYKPEMVELAQKFCLLGATNDVLAQLFDVSGGTIDSWLATKPDFAGAVRAGRAEADATIATSLFHRAKGYEHAAVKIFMVPETVVETTDGQTVTTHTQRERFVPYTERYAPDATSMIFWLKNRRPDLWRDKVQHEHTAMDELLALLDAAGERAKKK